ncbi:Spy/CpxP family protein refolding chaperone [Neisseria uirgultaei]|uniref:Spy/CpxP family protein refolding chaperone n=1 Tax=Neisseria uirgultaei TaxID=2830646 RepID=UPI002657E5C2|nr:hypothetical protein [Neisseria uirgultaei]
MPLPVSSHFAKPVASFFGMALLSCQISYAAPSYISLTDFQPNCDIRRLELSQEQRNDLRKIRAAFKLANDKAKLKGIRSERSRRQAIVGIISSDTFDRSEARGYVESRYHSSMDFAVDELEIQHRFFHILTPQQQQMWLSSCLK